MATTFNVGQTYSTRSICDHECIHSVTIVARTAKTVTFRQRGAVAFKRQPPLTLARTDIVAAWDCAGKPTFRREG
jgi:hypothetical protein